MLKVVFFILLSTVYARHATRVEDQDGLIKGPYARGQSNTRANNPTTTVASIDDTKYCTLDDGTQGECTPFYQCQNKTVNTDGKGVINFRFGDGCPLSTHTCCKMSNMLPLSEPILPTYDVTDPPTPTTRLGCGFRNPKGIDVHNNGDVNNEAKFGEFPWMVALLKLEPVGDEITEDTYIGGGSLINPSIVLTAAHYLVGEPQLRVRVGEWDTQTEEEIYPHQEIDVKEIVIHKDFYAEGLFYDVALLFLSESVMMSHPHIGLACLPQQKYKAVPGTRCVATGWGKDKFGKKGNYQVRLKKVEMPVVNGDMCQSQLRSARLGDAYQLHYSFMCAGGEVGKDVCTGDGGSPLICPIPYQMDRYVQNGIVSWGLGCGENGTPGVYVDVATVRNWIDGKVRDHGFDPMTYSFKNT